MTSDLAHIMLAHDLSLADLYQRQGLIRLDRIFLDFLSATDPALATWLGAARAGAPSPADRPALMLALAPLLDDFLAGLFGLRAPVAALAAAHDELAPLFAAKRQFVQRRAARAYPPAEAAGFDLAALTAEYETRSGEPYSDLGFARRVLGWLDDEAAHGDDLTLATRLAAARLAGAPGARPAGPLFTLPERRDPAAPPGARRHDEDGRQVWRAEPAARRARDGFDLTDPGTGLAQALDQARYCIHCAHQGKDSCRTGLVRRDGGAHAGCPLGVRISEMHETKAAGLPLAALAVVAVNNPLLAGTGHRICSACQEACIYGNQNRDPVDTPAVESRVLHDVLDLPWGFEIYSLLTRWNPLDFDRPLPLPPSGRAVLVVGLGPAGYTLAHHLLQDGHTVVAIDGLKIEPLDPRWSGRTADGARRPFQPLRDVRALARPLGERVPGGFGGVAEYGITARWDKNNLDLIRLLLERRESFALHGGVRFGGALDFDRARALGFDHVALALGAGRPTLPDLPGALARGVRLASDFLMTLQLTGAARRDALAHLQLRLPVVVIGGGLTAIDAATEALAYYPVEVESFLARVEALTVADGVSPLDGWPAAERAIAEEFIAHARAIRAERAAAAAEGRPPRLGALLAEWGGATVVYRRGLADSPAWRNRDEVSHALAEGIGFAEHLTPLAIETDADGAARAIRLRDAGGAEHVMPARTVLIAAGTAPNTALARELPGITLDGAYFQAVDEDGGPVTPERSPKPAQPAVLMRVEGQEGRVSFFGDLHPSYAGNVVSAMASAHQGHAVITRALARLPAGAAPPAEVLFAGLDDLLRPTVQSVTRLAPRIVELVVRAPAAARAFRPGQFFRLQNYERPWGRPEPDRLAMEGLALTGAWVDPAAGLVGMVVLEMGGSSDLVATLRPDEPVVLMGPSGAPTHVCGHETVLLVGGGLGNAVLVSIGAAFRAAGARVLYFAGYRTTEDRFKPDEIRAAADRVVWCVDRGAAFAAESPQEHSFVGNVIDAIEAYGQGRLGPTDLPLDSVDRVIVIGSDRMMAAVAAARHDRLAPWLKPDHTAIGSINAPMQCMLKEVCAQCLQRHHDPVSGETRFVFTCADQDQPLDQVDFASLGDRLAQNAVWERLGRRWIDLRLRQGGWREG